MLLKDRPTEHTHKINGPQWSLFGSPAAEDSSAGSQDGWLPGRERAAGRPPPPGAPVARRLTRAARRKPAPATRDAIREPDQCQRDGTRPASSRPENQTTSRCDQRTRPCARLTRRKLFVSFLSSSFSGAVRSCVACSHWTDRVSWLRILAKDRPGSDPLVVHWPQNDAFSDLAPGENEALRERTNSVDDSSSRRCCWRCCCRKKSKLSK